MRKATTPIHRRRSRRWGGLPIWAALALGLPGVARAESCYELRKDMQAMLADGFGIATDYPKTHASIVACLLANNSDSDRVGCAAGVVAAACVGMGFSSCFDLLSRWGRFRTNYVATDTAMQRQGCSQ